METKENIIVTLGDGRKMRTAFKNVDIRSFGIYPLDLADIDAVDEIDTIADFVFADALGLDSVWNYGLYEDSGKLIGYCNFSGAIDDDELEDGLYLRHEFYIREEYRDLKLGSDLLINAINDIMTKEKKNVYTYLWSEELKPFLEKIGFKVIKDNDPYKRPLMAWKDNK